MNKSDAVKNQSNVHDGTVLISQFDNVARDGAYITILGRAETGAAEEMPTIVAFDLADLANVTNRRPAA
ncbi:hypothetical protein SAMN04488550_4190 [Gordonia malaquae]|uniref:Uncharacterized protein n=1 Tax=Gordonia malaquae NBRC 108250 TaxID=1223542 RepID=M3VCA2_GORML|nr:hypothetical protein [Gordonia malaquae]GAC81658.1 hypothetical protein GM1_041_00290 [Gordonia malaquae NBRC 108250]SEE27360.1 hypothetical protein SAMN04488550_4190 [Gordonia malaquae]